MIQPIFKATVPENLTPQDIAEFKHSLSRQLDDLLSSAQRSVGALMQINIQSADPIEQAVFDVDRNYSLRIRDRESRLIKKIKNALAKIEDGTFGFCEACDEEIGLARLQARPVASYCIRCKTILEAREKVSDF